jgi:hypothetical protein
MMKLTIAPAMKCVFLFGIEFRFCIGVIAVCFFTDGSIDAGADKIRAKFWGHQVPENGPVGGANWQLLCFSSVKTWLGELFKTNEMKRIHCSDLCAAVMRGGVCDTADVQKHVKTMI